ncbi:polysaccharide biosynthesis/export family protein [uncultured Gelidibacter sp.]|uniref:polysaccharide biosynthesis/export family protein n=1 Tax=uncultured Gelidibacter sp. TaxID=259318 RepID=UPI00262F6FA2|nr:polysaccharide biosynthesis/export family protein [uncultured Gelidibacter sp.]
MKHTLFTFVALLILNSCASKKEILYFQDADQYNKTPINYVKPVLQPNDILKITVGALVHETTIPYNRSSGESSSTSVDLMKLDGYLISEDHTINFPELGVISTKNKTTSQLEKDLSRLLEEGGHLKNPTVNVRLLNAKVTILGEVKSPGTYNFTEESVTLLQALGMAGDLTINGKREDILVIRETDGVYKTTHLNLTSADLLTSPYYFIKPNDVIMINQNGPKVKSSGFIGNLGTLLSVFSIALSTVLIITK